MPPTYQITQEQLDEYIDLQQRNKKRSWLDRLLGRKQKAAERQSEHTYAGRYKSYDPLRFIHPYHPDDLDYDTLEWLADVYAVRPALMFIITTILAAIKNATIECKDPDVVAFVKELVHPKLLDLWEKSAKAFTYGVSFNEIVRRPEEVEIEREDKETGETKTAYKGYALFPDETRHNYIQTVTDVWKDPDTGKLAGYTQDHTTHVGLAQPGSTSWCFVYSINDMENPIWGKPEIRLVYSLAYWTDVFISLAMRRGEKEASGALIGFAPKGKTPVEGGEEEDNLEYMANILAQLQDHPVTVFPHEVDLTTKQQMWGFQEVALSERSDIAMKMLEYLGKWIFLTLLVPPDVLEVATKPFGSRSAVETLWDAFLVRMQGLGDRWADKVEMDLLNPLVREHFGQQAPKVELVLVLSQAQKDIIKEAFTAILANHPDVPRLDLPQMAEDLGIPVKKEEEMPAPEQPSPPKPEEEETPPGEEEKTPTPALTLELKEGIRWEEIVEQARLLLDVGVPAETAVQLYNPHHEPAGSPKGGQFAPKSEGAGVGVGVGMGGKVPPTNSSFKGEVLREKTFSAQELDMVREGAKILPQAHLDAVKNLAQGSIVSEGNGVCSEDGYITLSQEAIGGEKWGVGTVTHEIGHAVSFADDKAHLNNMSAIFKERRNALATDKKWGAEVLMDAVRARQRLDGFPSWYSQVNPAELFAESYKMYVISPKALQSRAPDLYNYMRDNVFEGVEYTE